MDHTNKAVGQRVAFVVSTNMTVFLFACLLSIAFANRWGSAMGNAIGCVSVATGLASCIVLSVIFLLLPKKKSRNFYKLLAFAIDIILLLLAAFLPLGKVLQMDPESYLWLRDSSRTVPLFALLGLTISVGINALCRRKEFKVRLAVQFASAIALAFLSILVAKTASFLALPIGIVQPFAIVFTMQELANLQTGANQTHSEYKAEAKITVPMSDKASITVDKESEAGNTCIVHFERQNNLFVGTAVFGNVIIDGKSVGSAANGTNFDVRLTFGSHSVAFESQITGMLASGRGNAETLVIPNDAKRVNVEIVVKQDVLSVVNGATKLGIGHVEIIR